MISLEDFVAEKQTLLCGLSDATRIAEEWCRQCPDLDDLDESAWLDTAHNSIKPQVEWLMGAPSPGTLEELTQAVMSYEPYLQDDEVLEIARELDEEREARDGRVKKIRGEMRAGTRPRVKIYGE